MKKMLGKFNSFKPKLILAFIFILLVPSILIGTLSFITAKNTLEDQIILGMKENIRLLDSSIDEAIQPKIENVELLSEKISSNLLNNDEKAELEHLLEQYGQYFSEIEFTYVGTETGEFITYPKIDLPKDFDPRERDWYKEAMNHKGKVILTKPYKNAATGEMNLTIAKTNSDHSGVIGIDIKLNYLENLTKQVKIGEKGFAILLDESGNFIYHPKFESGSEANKQYFKNMYKKNNGTISYTESGHQQVMSFDTNQLTGWKVGGSLLYSEVEESASPILKETLIVITITLFIGGVFIYLIIRSIIKPINRLKDHAVLISNGDLTEDIDIHTNDEIGQLAKSMVTMQENLKSLIYEISQSSEQLTGQSEELSQSANEVKSGSLQIASTMQEIAAGTESQANSASELATLMNALSSKIQHVNEFSQDVKNSANNISNMSNDGRLLMDKSNEQMGKINQMVQEAVKKMERLDDHSKEISKLVTVIKEIAEQTNLLALNAAIEAARAGEHGRGFAVVADEVRKLAEQVSDSVSDITNIVSNIQEETNQVSNSLMNGYSEVVEGTNQIKTTTQTFMEIKEALERMLINIHEITKNLEDITSESQVMNENIEDIASISEQSAAGVEQTAATIQQASSSMDEVAASSQDLAKLAEELNEHVKRFKL